METPGDREWGISGTWEIARGDQSLYIDFDGGGGDGLVTHPVERAYACHVRDRDELGLYFGKRSAPAWRREVEAFVASLDAAAR